MVTYKRGILRTMAAGTALLSLLALNGKASASEGEVWSTVRVYAYADAGALCIGKLKQGTALTVLDETQGHYEIDLYGMTGYIDKSDVSGTEYGYFVNYWIDGDTVSLECQQPQVLEAAREQVVALAREQLGVPYVWGGTTPAGFDCSGFVQYVYAQMGLDLARTATDQLAEGVAVDREQLAPGDLVFFNDTTDEPGIVTHVGIYIGGRQLIHAGPKGISIADIDGAYYAPRFVCARRLLVADPLPEAKVDKLGGRDPFAVQALEK